MCLFVEPLIGVLLILFMKGTQVYDYGSYGQIQENCHIIVEP